MKAKVLVTVAFFLLLFSAIKAQTNAGDSIKLANTLKELFTICRSADFKDPKSFELGLFYKAAPYIVYKGEDKTRAWKDLANYKNEEERKEVDAICERINGTVNRDSNFKIVQYLTYDKKGVTKKATFAFLRIGDRFALGDID
jgi:hypothetical protein